MVTVVVAVVVVGDTEGEDVGTRVGGLLGLADGAKVGAEVGMIEGDFVGEEVGLRVHELPIVPSSSRSIIALSASAALLQESSPVSEDFRNLDAVQTSTGC